MNRVHLTAHVHMHMYAYNYVTGSEKSQLPCTQQQDTYVLHLVT